MLLNIVHPVLKIAHVNIVHPVLNIADVTKYSTSCTKIADVTKYSTSSTKNSRCY